MKLWTPIHVAAAALVGATALVAVVNASQSSASTFIIVSSQPDTRIPVCASFMRNGETVHISLGPLTAEMLPSLSFGVRMQRYKATKKTFYSNLGGGTPGQEAEWWSRNGAYTAAVIIPNTYFDADSGQLSLVKVQERSLSGHFVAWLSPFLSGDENPVPQPVKVTGSFVAARDTALEPYFFWGKEMPQAVRERVLCIPPSLREQWVNPPVTKVSPQGHPSVRRRN